jgi:UDP-3-O-[3-hydroxymyristoyl] glucosamine N-acyltransferase
MKLLDIARAVGGELVGDGSLEIRGVAGIREAAEGELTFLAHSRYADSLGSTRASAILLARDGVAPPPGKAIIFCANPYFAFLQAIRFFAPEDRFAPGVDPTAVVGRDLVAGPGCSIGARCVIEDGVVLGARVVVRPGVFIGSGTRIGDDSLIHPNVTIRERITIGQRAIIHSGTVVGSDGFGFVREGERHLKVPQIGTVTIGDDVEIGANCAIDRGTAGATRIGRGTKIDNLVHVAHNVTIGENTLLVAQVGISGSTEIGSNVTLAGQVGVVGHIRVGDNAMVGAQSGVTKSVPADERWSGYPARPHAENLRAQAGIARLGEMAARVRALEERLDRLEGRARGGERP